MAGLSLRNICKVYPNGLKAVTDFNMEIEDKEFIVFVGPSGCGKSTTLRMIAGLEEISAGELYIGDVLVNDVEPKDRDIAMVFQNYALYPHMTVYDNIAFGLKLRKIPDEAPADTVGLKGKVNAVLRALHIKKGEPSGKMVKVMRHLTKEEIDEKVNEAAEILGITEYLKKKPKEMSGGQRQRVALGRAIVREPKVFLLDEPLSNLDAKLRASMRIEISKLHQKLQTTFIYVTHDQVEAMTMGTRIVVMKDGVVQQIDTPHNLYNYPVNKFVAGFIGTPQMNFYSGNIQKEGESLHIVLNGIGKVFTIPQGEIEGVPALYRDGKKKLYFGIRSEHISVEPEKYACKAKCRVSYVENLGSESQVYADFNINGESIGETNGTKVILKAPATWEAKEGDVIEVSVDLANMHFFDGETEQTIYPLVPAEKGGRGLSK
jgi:multiple sugar transport system ATP-binding protein